jgi:hypothetical protein
MHRKSSSYSGVLFIREFIVDSTPYREIGLSAELEIVSSAEDLFRHAHRKTSLDFLIITVGVSESCIRVDTWIRTLRMHHPEIPVYIVLDTSESVLPRHLTENVDCFFDRVESTAAIPKLIFEQLNSSIQPEMPERKRRE